MMGLKRRLLLFVSLIIAEPCWGFYSSLDMPFARRVQFRSQAKYSVAVFLVHPDDSDSVATRQKVPPKDPMDNMDREMDEGLQGLRDLEASIEDPETASVRSFAALPYSVRLAVCRALGMEPSKARDPVAYANIVTKFKKTCTPQQLRDSYRFVTSEMVATQTREGRLMQSLFDTIKTNDGSTIQKFLHSKEVTNRLTEGYRDFVQTGDTKRLFDVARPETIAPVMRIPIHRKSEAVPIRIVERVVSVLEQGGFRDLGEPDNVLGMGVYTIKGTTSMTGREIRRLLDSKLSRPIAKAVFCCNNADDKSVTVMVLPPELCGGDNKNGVIQFLSSMSALFFANMYFISVFDDSVIRNAVWAGDTTVTNLFRDNTAIVIVAFLAIQTIHEIGHQLACKGNSLETHALPTLIPAFGFPFFGTMTNLKTNPPDRKSLFDFAFLGPFLGTVVSLSMFGWGMMLTNAANDVALFPMLPLATLHSSTLGTLLAGGLSARPDATTVALHPLAMAGFWGLITQALSLIPVGATDGARMFMALFGTSEPFSNASWLVLFFCSMACIFSPNPQVDAGALVMAWLALSLTQNKEEILCQDEVDGVGLPRTVLGLTFWLVTISALIPTQPF